MPKISLKDKYLTASSHIWGAPALSLASQAMGVLQLAALLFRYGPTNATDSYFYLFNLGNLPTQVLLVGVFYPLLLNDQRISRRAARGFAIAGAILGSLAVIAGSLWLNATGRVEPEIVPIIALSAINATFQAVAWHRAIAAEAGGTAIWISGVALPANALATVVILLPWPSSAATVTAMTASLGVANGLLGLIMIKRNVGSDVLAGLPPKSSAKYRSAMWFGAKSGVSYVGVLVIQSISLVLPPAVLTLLAIPLKVVGSITATFTNAILPRLIQQSSTTMDGGRKFIKVATALLGLLGVLVISVTYILYPEWTLVSVIISLWLVGGSAASVAQRLAMRFLPPSASRITIVVVPVVVLATVVSAQYENFGLISLLCAYAVVDGAAAWLLLLALRDRFAVVVCVLTTGLLTAIWIYSLMIPSVGPQV